ncbi:hypothetical protein [Pseudomonas chlororaphis]|uniref:hypothetical protein n=1 Tax=Pseudomonas chlororaphis TaxID=587753 RepID=UPI001389BC0E
MGIEAQISSGKAIAQASLIFLSISQLLVVRFFGGGQTLLLAQVLRDPSPAFCRPNTIQSLQLVA